MNNDSAKGKPNYRRYYKESSFIELYKGISDIDAIIKEAHKIRNSNPLSHSSAELIDSDTSVTDILSSIGKLSLLIESKMKEL